MRPRDLFRGPRGAIGGARGPRGLRETTRGSHWAIGLVWGVSWWFMRHICLYIGVKIFSAYGFTRGSTKGPRGPKKWGKKWVEISAIKGWERGFRRLMANAIKNFNIIFGNPSLILDPLGEGESTGRNIILSSQRQFVGAATKRFYWTRVWPLLFHSFSYTLTCVLGCKCVSVCACLRLVFGCAVYIPPCVYTKWPRWPSNNRGPQQSVFFPRKSLRIFFMICRDAWRTIAIFQTS